MQSKFLKFVEIYNIFRIYVVHSFCFNSILKPFIPSSIALLPLMLPLQTVTIMIIVVTCLRVLHFMQPNSGNKRADVMGKRRKSEKLSGKLDKTNLSILMLHMDEYIPPWTLTII